MPCSKEPAMRATLQIVAFFFATPVLIVVTLFLFVYHAHTLALLPQKQVAYAALPQGQGVLAASINTNDSRLTSLQNFLSRYHSPLLPFANIIIQDADIYGLDYCLVPAIAFQESGLCNKALPTSLYNCYGWGITKHHVVTFTSYQDGIDIVSSGLSHRGDRTPQEIGTWYNPTNTDNWVQNVANAMNECHQSL